MPATITNLEKGCPPACAGIYKKEVNKMRELDEELVVLDAGFDAGPEISCCTASFSVFV
jgi:hypothetical protein